MYAALPTAGEVSISPWIVITVLQSPPPRAVDTVLPQMRHDSPPAFPLVTRSR